MSVDVQTLRAQLQQLEQLHASGTLSAEQYTESKTRLERRVLDLVMAGAPAAPVVAVPAARPSKRLIGIAAAFAVLVAGGGYALYGAPSFFGMGPSSTLAQGAGPGAGDAAADPTAGAAAGKHTMGVEQIAAMVDRLAARMKENPNDGEGWTMLARSYTVLGRHAEAVPAYQKALALHVEDPSLLADYADSLAVVNKNSIEGEPLKLIERALKLDPDHTKALSLAGSAAFDRKDYASAVKYWERIITSGKANPELVPQIQNSVAEARQLGGMPASTVQPPAAPMAPAAAATGMAPAAPAQAAAPAAAAGAFVAGKVTITAAMLGKTSPEDSVFIFARAAEGPRMPLAALRKQVKDLPVTFKLDDSMGMTPQMKLSSFDKVVVSARVSKSGNPIAQPGDLQGSSVPVALGSGDLKIEINQVVGQ
ncbi:MAG: c-type cytochrome biogenesis protein CcmI [Leptothrix sp. (in: b-proteobacteria)]